jgi:hypothetical protein
VAYEVADSPDGNIAKKVVLSGYWHTPGCRWAAPGTILSGGVRVRYGERGCDREIGCVPQISGFSEIRQKTAQKFAFFYFSYTYHFQYWVVNWYD